ncbi:MAG: hypothetical protein K2W96_19150 [Gemmataceae bacterium]|nr:hypothetical protein [Gemmataceae bacterium]
MKAAPSPAPSVPMLVIAALSLLIWLPILPFTQPEQQKRRAFERAFVTGRYDEAAALLRGHPLEEFPPYWLPQLGDELYLHQTNAAMLAALHEDDGPAWAVELYAARMHRGFGRGRFWVGDAERLAETLPRSPAGRAMLAEARAKKEPEQAEGHLQSLLSQVNALIDAKAKERCREAFPWRGGSPWPILSP